MEELRELICKKLEKEISRSSNSDHHNGSKASVCLVSVRNSEKVNVDSVETVREENSKS